MEFCGRSLRIPRRQPRSPLPYSSLASGALPADDARNAGWQNDFNVALASAEQDVRDGQLGAGDIAVDRAEAVLTTERLIGASANPEFSPPPLAASIAWRIANRPTLVCSSM